MRKPLARTVPALLAEIAARSPAAPAVTDGTRSWTYAALHAEVQACAGALLAAGVRHGDRVGILAGNRAEWLIADFAAMSLGAITVGLNTWSTARELAYQLAHAEVSVLFIEPRFRDRDFRALLDEARAHAGALPALREIVFLGAAGEAGEFAAFVTRGADVAPATVAAAAAALDPEDVACLLYTSGSTALPKGVPLVHRGLIDNMWEIGERQRLTADDRLWLAVSLFWSLACVNALFALVTHGGGIVLQHHFDAGEALRLIERQRCTVFYGTPNMALALAEHPDRARRDLSSLRTGVTIGTPAQVARVAELGAARICNVYGLTETYGNSTVTAADLPLARRIETVGRPLAGNAIRIRDPAQDVDQPAGTPGEIQVRGNVTRGYWNDPVRTAEAFTADGWFRSGDLGFVDDEGFLFYRGRLKEMVKTGGINVAPAEVEEILAAHPAVELAFVTGIPDPRLDEALAAVIVPKRGATVEAAALRAHCQGILAAYKVPRHFLITDASALPLTTTGKLQRNRLAALFA
ncbi:MAG: class I adenylate-forming enzyme family protein [Gammaproteobacteria bacterium]